MNTVSFNHFLLLTKPDPKFDIDIRLDPQGEPDPVSGKVLYAVTVIVTLEEQETKS